MNYNKFIIALFVFATYYAMAQEDENGIRTTEYKNGIGDIIYCTGYPQGGGGIFWIYENNEKRIILEEYLYENPSIGWLDEYLAEIDLLMDGEYGYGIYSYFFDFNDNTISNKYYYPVYVDIKNRCVITLRGGGLDIYNIKTNEIIQEFRKEGLFEGVVTFWYFYFNYEISIKNNRLLFSYDYYRYGVEIHKMVEFEYNY